jgi:hypothetical protein
MKNFKSLISEVSAKARSPEEQRFVDQHEVEVTPHPVAPESQFKGTIDKKKRLADYEKGQDSTSYDKAYTVKNKTNPMKESYETNEMLIRQLHFIQYAAEEIVDFLEEGNEVEAWYQNKLAVVFDKMQGLHAYAEGEMYKSGEDEMDFNPYYESLEESFKAGNLKLDNNDTVKISAQDAKLLNDLMKDLDDKNRKNFEQILMTDKSGFDEIVGFAREAL